MVELKRKVTLKTKSAASEEDAAEKVHLKKKVTIKEKDAEEELPTSGNDGGNEGNPTPTPEHPKGRKWILWLIIIVALAIIGYLWHSHSGSSEQGDGNLGDSTKVENADSTKELSANEKQQLKDKYKLAFKEAMLACQFDDMKFDDLTLEQKIQLLTKLDDEKWNGKPDPTEFMEKDDLDKLYSTVMKG